MLHLKNQNNRSLYSWVLLTEDKVQYLIQSAPVVSSCADIGITKNSSWSLLINLVSSNLTCHCNLRGKRTVSLDSCWATLLCAPRLLDWHHLLQTETLKGGLKTNFTVFIGFYFIKWWGDTSFNKKFQLQAL